MPPRVAPRGRGRGRGRPPIVPRVTRANAQGARATPAEADIVRERMPGRMRVAEARAALEAEIAAGVYADDFEDESVADIPVPEVRQPEPQAEAVVVPPEPTALELIQHLTDVISEAIRTRPATVPVAPVVPVVPTCSLVMREFMRMNPLTFHGGIDSMVAENWLEQTEKVFEALQITDDTTKVLLANYQLRDAADLWWKSVRNTRGVDGVTWAQFQELFLE